MTGETAPNTLAVANLNHFVAILQEWHSLRVHELQKMLEMPEGFSMNLNDLGYVPLTGDLLTGFKAGLETALIQLGKLPFVVEFENEANEEPQQ